MYRVIVAPEAEEELFELRDYIEERSSRRTAERYIRRIRKFYEALAIAPHRGEYRFKHRPGMRSIGFERRITIIFSVSDEDRLVSILSFYYAGREV